MNKSEFVDAIAAKAKLSKKDVEGVIEGLKSVLKEMPVGEKVSLVGFGNFQKTHKAAGTARNPAKPGTTVETKARDVVSFKISKSFLG